MSNLFVPCSISELAEAVGATSRVIPIGSQTKSRLSEVQATRIGLGGLNGIVEYDPSEFTFTALAGTPVSEIAETLAARGQYMPFSPMLMDAGATLGGTIASGLSGAGRFRYGGLRDFILGIQIVDGSGRLLRFGGKVVKNAAGFDLPKFLIGSMGRLGVLVEATFKVFPLPKSSVTMVLDPLAHEDTVKALMSLGTSRWEIDALDVLPNPRSIMMRLRGPASAIASLAREVLERWNGRQVPSDEADALWLSLQEFQWSASDHALIKVPLAISDLARFCYAIDSIPGASAHISGGGNVAYVSLPSVSVAAFDSALSALRLSGLTIRGNASLWSGFRSHSDISHAVKTVFDPQARFPGMNE